MKGRRAHGLVAPGGRMMLLACALAPTGCGPEGHGDPGGEPLPVWAVGSSPSVSIGELEGDTSYVFSRIAAVRLLPGGRILVADGSSGTIRIFDGEGRFERQMGRPGQGPGEFSWLGDAFQPGPDTIAAYDSRSQRLTTFLMNGEVTSTLSFNASDGYPEMYLGRYADGAHALAWIKQVRGSGDRLIPDLMEVARFSPTGDSATPLAADVGMRRLGGSPVPFSPHFLAVMVGDTVFHTDGVAGRIVATGPSGDTVRVLHLTGAPLEEASAFRRLEPVLDSAAARRLEALRSRSDLDTVPTISDMLPGEEGRLWLKRYAPETDSHWLGRPRTGGEWLVVETDGTPVARVTIPAGLRLMDVAGDRLAGVAPDDLGVERVRVYVLERG